MAYKMKGSPMKRNFGISPVKQAVTLESDREAKIGDAFRSDVEIEERTRNNAIDRSEQETAIQSEGTEQAELRERERNSDRTYV